MSSGLLTVLRVLVGVLIFKTGLGLVRNGVLLFGYSSFESFLTGVFIAFVGVHVVLSSLFGDVFKG